MWSLPLRGRTGWLAAILGVALVLRVVAALGLQWQLDHVLHRQFLIEGDASGYLHLAQCIAEGKPYEIYTPPRRALRMPGFPAFLALVMRVCGSDMLPLRLSLCAVGTAACGLTYWLGRDLAGSAVGLIAAAIAAVSPLMVGLTPLILSETLFALTLLASLIALARLFEHHAPGKAAQPALRYRGSGLALLCGALAGVACYVRPSWLLVGPLYGLALVLLSNSRRQAAWHAVLVTAGLVAVLIPWGIRNYHATGHFVLTTLWVGPSLYDGLNPQANGDSDMTFFDRDNLLSRMSEYEVDRYYRRAAWKFVVEHPTRTVQLAALKLARFWNPWPNAPQFHHWALRLVTAGTFLPVIALALVGVWRLRNNFRVLLLAVGPVLYFSAIHMVFVGSVRYRVPAEYPLLVLAAVGVQSLAFRFGVCRPDR